MSLLFVLFMQFQILMAIPSDPIELNVQTQEFSYQANLSPHAITLKSALIDLRLSAPTHNQVMIDALLAQYHESSKIQVMPLKSEESLTVTMNKKTIKISISSKLGKFLYELPEKIKTISRY